jgi:hypothetical protein
MWPNLFFFHVLPMAVCVCVCTVHFRYIKENKKQIFNVHAFPKCFSIVFFVIEDMMNWCSNQKTNIMT